MEFVKQPFLIKRTDAHAQHPTPRTAFHTYPIHEHVFTAHQQTTPLTLVPFCRTHSPPLKSNSGRPRSVGTNTRFIHLARAAPES